MRIARATLLVGLGSLGLAALLGGLVVGSNPFVLYAYLDAETKRFPQHSAEILEAGQRGKLALVRVMGRQITVYPREGDVYQAYAFDPSDPLIGALIAKLDRVGVSTEAPDETPLAAAMTR